MLKDCRNLSVGYLKIDNLKNEILNPVITMQTVQVHSFAPFRLGGYEIRAKLDRDKYGA